LPPDFFGGNGVSVNLVAVKIHVQPWFNVFCSDVTNALNQAVKNGMPIDLAVRLSQVIVKNSARESINLMEDIRNEKNNTI
jgi:hypothetical protein